MKIQFYSQSESYENFPKVAYLECAQARVALVAVTSTFHESWLAGEQRPDMQGRPGVNPLRFQTVHHVSAERLEQLRSKGKKMYFIQPIKELVTAATSAAAAAAAPEAAAAEE